MNAQGSGGARRELRINVPDDVYEQLDPGPRGPFSPWREQIGPHADHRGIGCARPVTACCPPVPCASGSPPRTQGS